MIHLKNIHKTYYNGAPLHVLKGIDLDIAKGEFVSIMGASGSGKSTLLKAVSGIMVPTEGRMEINGSVAALLELGSGFDPDLTVRENTYLRGAMLGYTRAFMDERYEEIIRFAELEKFEDYQFKQLSSGMLWEQSSRITMLYLKRLIKNLTKSTI